MSDPVNKSLLPTYYRKVMMYLYGVPDGERHSLEEAAAQFGYTVNRVRQIHSVSIRRLTAWSRKQEASTTK